MDNTYTNIYSFNVLRQDSWAAKSRLTRSAFAGVAGCIFWQLTFGSSGSGKPNPRLEMWKIQYFLFGRGAHTENRSFAGVENGHLFNLAPPLPVEVRNSPKYWVGLP